MAARNSCCLQPGQLTGYTGKKRRPGWNEYRDMKL